MKKKRPDLHAPHDGGYRLLFSHPRMVADLLRGFVQEPWVEELDFESLERIPGTYVSDQLDRRVQDVVWRLRWHGQPVYVYLVIEFQSTIDKTMAVRILVYVGLLYQDLIRRGEALPDGRLPPVLPLVLYNGDRPWDAALEVGDLIAPGPMGLAAYSPRLRYALVDEGRLPAAALEQPGNLMAALAALERGETPAQIAQVVARLVRWLGQPRDRDLRRAFVSWMQKVLVPARLGGVVVPEVQELEEFRTMLEERVVQWTEEWKRQGLSEGRKEGRKEGRREGRREGLREGLKLSEALLLRQLQLKFGDLDDEVMTRIADATGDQRLRWAERLLGAETLEQVFAS